MQTVVIVIHLMIVAVLIASVLLQQSEGGGLGMGGGGGFMSSRGTANLLTRTTAILAVGFFLTSLLLSWLASFDRRPTSIFNTERRPRRAHPRRPRRLSCSRRGGILDTLKQERPAAEPRRPQRPQAPRSQ